MRKEVLFLTQMGYPLVKDALPLQPIRSKEVLRRVERHDNEERPLPLVVTLY